MSVERWWSISAAAERTAEGYKHGKVNFYLFVAGITLVSIGFGVVLIYAIATGQNVAQGVVLGLAGMVVFATLLLYVVRQTNQYGAFFRTHPVDQRTEGTPNG